MPNRTYANETAGQALHIGDIPNIRADNGGKAPYPVTIRQVANGYVCEIGCQTYVHEGGAMSGLTKLYEGYFKQYEKQ